MAVSDAGELIDRIPAAQALESRGVMGRFGVAQTSQLVPQNVNFWDNFDGGVYNGYVEVKADGGSSVVRRPGKRVHADIEQFVQSASDFTGLHSFWDSTGQSTLLVTDEEWLYVDPSSPIHCGAFGLQIRNFGNTFYGPVGIVGLPSTTGSFTTDFKFAGEGTSVGLPTGPRYLVASNRGGHKSVWLVADDGTFTLLTSAPAWEARDGFWLIGNGNFTYLMGGRNAAGTKLNDVWRTSDGITWTQRTAAAGWAARDNARAIRVGTSTTWLVMGGENAAGTKLNDVWQTTDSGTTFTQLTAAAAWPARELFALAQQELWPGRPANEIVLVGGVGASGDITDNTFWVTLDGITWTPIVVAVDEHSTSQNPRLRSLYSIADTFKTVAFSATVVGLPNFWYHVWKFGEMMHGDALSSSETNFGVNQGEIIQMNSGVGNYMISLIGVSGSLLAPTFSKPHSIIRARFSLAAG